jgi:hypothetical protein
MPITLACVAFRISESCYRYQPKLQAENAQIADWLVRLTENNRNWGVRPELSVPAKREGLRMESQAGLSHLSEPRAEPADQAEEAHGA